MKRLLLCNFLAVGPLPASPVLIDSVCFEAARWWPFRGPTPIAAAGGYIYTAYNDMNMCDTLPGVYFARSSDGGATWQTQRVVPGGGGSYFNYPSVAAWGATVHLFYRVNATLKYLRSTDAGGSWSPDTTLSMSGTAVRARGDTLHLVYPAGGLRYARSADAGLTWGKDTAISPGAVGSRDPDLWVSGDTIHTVWSDNRDGNREIYYKGSYDGGETWGPDVRLTADSTPSLQPRVAASGNAVHLSWADSLGEDIYSNVFYNYNYGRSTDGGASWEPSRTLTYDTLNCVTSRAEYVTAIAADGQRVVMFYVAVDTVFGDTCTAFCSSAIYRLVSDDTGATWRGPYYAARTTGPFDEPRSPYAFTDSVGAMHLTYIGHGNLTTIDTDFVQVYYDNGPFVQAEERLVPPRGGSPITLLPLPRALLLIPSAPTNVSLYDVSGRLVKSIYVERETKVALKPGVYFVRPAGAPALKAVVR